MGSGPSIDDQRGYYSDRWGRFEHANVYDLARMSKTLDFMAKIKLPNNPQICDLGCGAGWSTNILSTFGEATGVDLSDVAKAQSRYPHCRFRSENIIEWSVPNSEFDLVVSLEVVEHIETSDQDKFFGVVRTMLKAGGHMILTTPNKRTMEAIRGGGRTWSNQPVENWLTAAQLRSLITRNGLEVVSMTSIILDVGSLGSYRLINSAKLNLCVRALGLQSIWQSIAGGANYGLHLAVLARKP